MEGYEGRAGAGVEGREGYREGARSTRTRTRRRSEEEEEEEEDDDEPDGWRKLCLAA